MASGQRGMTTARASVPWLIVLALVVVGVSPTRPTAPQDRDTDATRFAAGRAMDHVRDIAQVPHPMGSREIARVRRYLTDELERLGLEVDAQTTTAPDYFGGGEPIDVVNVIGWIPGTAHTGAVVFVAHYDTAPTTPGANDNTAAVAALLETARALRAGPALANDIVFLFTDGEEPAGRYGARAFFAVPEVVDRLGLVVDFEALGHTGASLLVATNGPESWLIEHYAAAETHPAAFSFLTELSRLLGEVGTDFDVVRAAGIPGFHFAYLRGSPVYHTPDDDIASVDLGSVQHHGSHAVAIARHFGDLDLGRVPESDGTVFFMVRRSMVSYSARWAVPIAVLAVAGLGGARFVRRRRRLGTLPEVTRSAATSLLATLAAALAGTLAWMLVATVRSRPGVVESYAYGALVLGGTLLLGRLLVGRGERRTARAQREGWAVLWVLLAVVTAAALPGMSYLFVWPALAAAGALVWQPRRRPSALARFAALATVALVLMTPVIDVLFSLAQPLPGNPDAETTAAMFAPLTLALLVAGLLGGGWERPEPNGSAEE